MSPLVSVIIPTKNSAKCLEHCLASIKNQTYKNIELIVVDNNSTDQTKQIAEKFTDKIFNYGPERSAQRNFGANNSKGKYLLIHDSDIYFHPDSVSECVDLLANNDYQAAIMPEKSIGPGFWTKVKAFERSFYVGNDFIEAARFFNRATYFKLGGYDENLTGPEDWDLTVRARKSGCRIALAKNFLEHDEGKLDLFGSTKKKKYYSQDMFEKYAQKHPDYFKKQMNFWVRFPLDKLLVNFIKHPTLAFCMFLMKGLELINSKR
jgi:glycosyltransferase involved in cell wall biosynthesis